MGLIQEMLSRSLDGENGGFSRVDMVLCPKCGFEYVKLFTPQIMEGNDNYEAWEGRGSAIKIEAECENGCVFSVWLGFHKGQTFAFTQYA